MTTSEPFDRSVSPAAAESVKRVLLAVESIRSGGMVIMTDDEDRENEGDLVFAAVHTTPEKINFMAKEARGLICLTMEPSQIERLQLPMMVDHLKSSSARSTAFTVSIEARHGVTTGISAADRAQTVKVAIDPTSTPDDIVVPGHVFPLKAKPGGVLERSGHTEGSVDIVRLAGLKQPAAAVICEIMKDDGTMARMDDLTDFAAKHKIPLVSIADLITFRLMRDSLIERTWEGPIRTAYGTFRGVTFKSLVDGVHHLALIKQEKKSDSKDSMGAEKVEAFGDQVVDVRVHRQRPLVDVFADETNGGRQQIEYGLKMLKKSSAAVLLYLMLDRPNDAIKEDLTHLGAEPGEQEATQRVHGQMMDPRLYGIGAQILLNLGVRRMATHVSTPRLLKGLAGYGLEVVETIIIPPAH